MVTRDELVSERCAACRRDSPRVTEEEAESLAQIIPDWQTLVVDGVPRLQRVFRTRSYPLALAITQAVGEVAEGEGHHPVIVTEARSVTVTWWTHAIQWLHRNDFIMAAKTDEIVARTVTKLDIESGTSSLKHA